MTINFALAYIINFGYIFTVKFSSAIKTLDKFIFFGMSDLEHLCVGTYLTLLTKIALINISLLRHVLSTCGVRTAGCGPTEYGRLPCHSELDHKDVHICLFFMNSVGQVVLGGLPKYR